MQIKLSRLKQIISEVVEEKYADERMGNIMQSTREEEVVEEIDPHDQALDDMIAEEIEAAMEQFVLGEDAELMFEGVDKQKAASITKSTLDDASAVSELEKAIESDPKIQAALEQVVKEMETQMSEGQVTFNEIYGNFDPSKKHYAVDDPGRVLISSISTPFVALGLAWKTGPAFGALLATMGLTGGVLAASALGVGLAGAALWLYLSKKKKEADLKAKAGGGGEEPSEQGDRVERGELVFTDNKVGDDY